MQNNFIRQLKMNARTDLHNRFKKNELGSPEGELQGYRRLELKKQSVDIMLVSALRCFPYFQQITTASQIPKNKVGGRH